jgi:hypothetical protein
MQLQSSAIFPASGLPLAITLPPMLKTKTFGGPAPAYAGCAGGNSTLFSSG